MPIRPRTLHDEDYVKLHRDHMNDAAIAAHPANNTTNNQSHDTIRMISTITNFHEMVHNNDLEEINNHQSSLLRECSVAIDKTTPASFITPTSDSLNSCVLSRHSHVSLNNNSSYARVNNEANLNNVIADREERIQSHKPSKNTEKTFSLLLCNWNKLGLDKTFIQGTVECECKKIWMQEKGVHDVFSKKKTDSA